MQKFVTNFKALGSHRRLVILCFLRDESKNVNDVANFLKVTHSTASYHMKKLQREGYIVEQRQGKFTYYSVSPQLKPSRLYRQLTQKK